MGGRDSKTGAEELAITARVHALIERGLRHYAQGDVQAAMADWEHALALDPDSERARQYLDETNGNLETFDQMPSEAEDMDGLFPLASADAVSEMDPDVLLATADSMDDIPSMDTLDDGWLLYDQPPIIEQVRPEAEQMLPRNLRAVAEELLGIAQHEQAGPDADRTPPEAADSDTRWYREPAVDAQSAALAPTVELVLPEGLGALFESGEDSGADSDPMADQDSVPLPPGIPPVIIEESGDDSDTTAYSTSPGGAVVNESAAPEEFDDALTFEREQPRAERETSRTRTLEMPLAAPAGSFPPNIPAAPRPSSVALRLLDELEAYTPADPESDESLRRRLRWLIERAENECVAGNNDAAITALDLALDEQPDSAIAQKLIHRHLDTILDIYERYLDNPTAVPALQISPSEFREHAIDNRAAFLLTRIDGVLTVEDILDVSGMPRLETCRYLCSMLRRGILTLR